MNNKAIKTYNNIYKNPIQSDISWKDIEKLFLALGAIKSVRKFLENAGVQL